MFPCTQLSHFWLFILKGYLSTYVHARTIPGSRAVAACQGPQTDPVGKPWCDTHRQGILPCVFLNSVVQGVHSFAWEAAIVAIHF